MARSLTDQEIEWVRAAYWDPFHPLAPVIGNPQEADCIWTQAFSRGSNPKYNDKNFKRNIRILRRKARFDDAETFRLLQEDGIDPGNANGVLARLGIELAGALRQRRDHPA